MSTIDQNFIYQFGDTLHMLLEQEKSKLRGIFAVEQAKGEKHFFDRLAGGDAIEITSRNQATQIDELTHSRRMATVKRYGKVVAIDDIDKLKMGIDPTSPYMQRIASALGRKFDDVVIAALLGDAATGKDGDGSVASFDSSMVIAHGNAGLTVDKFNQALRLLQSNEVDIEDGNLVLLVGARGIEDLFGDSNNRFTSFDYMSSKPLADGKLPMFRGVRILHSERVTDIDATNFRGLLVHKDCLKVAMNKDVEVKVGERADLNYITQLGAYMQFGAVRMEEGLIVDIRYQ